MPRKTSSKTATVVQPVVETTPERANIDEHVANADWPKPATAPVASVASDDLAYLKAQRSALDEQIRAAKLAAKEAKAAQPKASKLDWLIARQNANVSEWTVNYLTTRIRARVAAGQARDEAAAGVFALYTDAVRQALDAATIASDPDGELTCAFCGGPVGLDGECTRDCDASRDASESTHDAE